MSYDQLEVIVNAAAVIIALIFANIIEPYIKSKLTQTELEKLKDYISIAVRCAEQIYTPEQWSDKKQHVVKYIKELMGSTINLELTDDEIDILIEGIVYEVKKC